MDLKFTITELKDEAFTSNDSLFSTEIEKKRAELEQKYDGRISFAKVVLYVPILTKDSTHEPVPDLVKTIKNNGNQCANDSDQPSQEFQKRVAESLLGVLEQALNS